MHASGVVLEQLAYSPYGRPVAYDILTTDDAGRAFGLRAGRQGLFFDNLNLLTGQPGGDGDGDGAGGGNGGGDGDGWNPPGGSRLIPLALDTLSVDPSGAGAPAAPTGLYHNRNRTFNPTLGRFMQRDPHGLGLYLLKEGAFGGRVVNASFRFGWKVPVSRSCAACKPSNCDECRDVVPAAQFDDGYNTFLRAKSNPPNSLDPDGRFAGFIGSWLGGFESAGMDAQRASAAASLAGNLTYALY